MKIFRYDGTWKYTHKHACNGILVGVVRCNFFFLVISFWQYQSKLSFLPPHPNKKIAKRIDARSEYFFVNIKNKNAYFSVPVWNCNVFISSPPHQNEHTRFRAREHARLILCNLFLRIIILELFVGMWNYSKITFIMKMLRRRHFHFSGMDWRRHDSVFLVFLFFFS